VLEECEIIPENYVTNPFGDGTQLDIWEFEDNVESTVRGAELISLRNFTFSEHGVRGMCAGYNTLAANLIKADIDLGTTYSVCAFVWSNDDDPDGIFLTGHREYDDEEFFNIRLDGNLHLVLSDGSGGRLVDFVTDDSPFVFGEWNHVGYGIQGNEVKIWSTLLSTGETKEYTIAIPSEYTYSPDYMHLFDKLDGAYTGGNLAVDDLRFFDRILTKEEANYLATGYAK
jgi:hypothetical protein